MEQERRGKVTENDMMWWYMCYKTHRSHQVGNNILERIFGTCEECEGGG